MAPRVFDSLIATLIRIGLLIALVVLLMAEKAQTSGASFSHAAKPAVQLKSPVRFNVTPDRQQGTSEATTVESGASY